MIGKPVSPSTPRKRPTPLAAGLAGAVLVSCAGVSLAAPAANAEPSSYRFDFGSGPVENGFIGVKAADAYRPETRYGFNTPENMGRFPTIVATGLV